ncbi:MAG: tetratricopeptide repeat protein [Candidatus Jettenia sp.]|nr:MAG: tetratricopeptide repeat protein [Candidatus Jettenia sp.]
MPGKAKQYVEACYNLGIACYKKKQYNDAAAAFEKAVEFNLAFDKGYYNA